MSYVDRSNVGMFYLFLPSILERTLNKNDEAQRLITGNAKLFGALEDLGMTSQQWNTALSVFFITYALGGV